MYLSNNTFVLLLITVGHDISIINWIKEILFLAKNVSDRCKIKVWNVTKRWLKRFFEPWLTQKNDSFDSIWNTTWWMNIQKLFSSYSCTTFLDFIQIVRSLVQNYQNKYFVWIDISSTPCVLKVDGIKQKDNFFNVSRSRHEK